MDFHRVKMYKDKVSTKMSKIFFVNVWRTFQEIRIIATGPCITNQLRDVNTICRRSWYIAAHIWKIYDFKIEVIPFIINFSSEAIILISWNVIFFWEADYWTRAIKIFTLFDLLKSLYSDTKILSKYILSLQRRLQNVLTKRSSSYTIWFQMRCWMTSCLNHNCLILIFIHFSFMKIHQLLLSLQRQNIFRQDLDIGI
jgi:hypothetical protein